MNIIGAKKHKTNYVTLSNITMIKIDYHFYSEYLEDSVFRETYERRFDKIKKDIQSKYLPTENVLEEFFVEIFSWTVLPRQLLYEIDTIVALYVPNYVLIDPCSGNSFHTFLFHQFCKRNVITIDIQIEDKAWIDTIECDGLSYMQHKIQTYDDKVLLLAWIDYDDLTVGLLRAYTGKVVISIGNYDHTNANQYLSVLNQKYRLIKHYELEMPWKSIEHIRIYLYNSC